MGAGRITQIIADQNDAFGMILKKFFGFTDLDFMDIVVQILPVLLLEQG